MATKCLTANASDVSDKYREFAGRDQPNTPMTTHTTNVFQFARRHHLSLSAMWALLVLRENPDMAITMVGDAVGISSAAITGVVDTLANVGLVERTHGELDRRKVFIRLTEKATGLLDAYCPNAEVSHGDGSATPQALKS